MHDFGSAIFARTVYPSEVAYTFLLKFLLRRRVQSEIEKGDAAGFTKLAEGSRSAFAVVGCVLLYNAECCPTRPLANPPPPTNHAGADCLEMRPILKLEEDALLLLVLCRGGRCTGGSSPPKWPTRIAMLSAVEIS